MVPIINGRHQFPGVEILFVQKEINIHSRICVTMGNDNILSA